MDWGTAGHVDLAVKTPFTPKMPKKISDMAVEKVPSISSRFSLFQSKLQIAHYTQGSITDYCHALYKAVVYLSKSPDDFSQADVDGYLQHLLSRKPMPAEAQFKHFIYGLKCYRSTMGLSTLEGLALPKIRRERKLPRIMSVREVMLLLNVCELYSKTLFGVIYDCGLRCFEACNLKWNDISFDRHQVHIKKGKGGKDRIVDYDTKTGMVTYDWKDYRHGAVHKLMRMHAVEFLHLFSLHILPPAFVRIRHYGLLSPSNRDKVRKVQVELGGTPVPKNRRKKSYTRRRVGILEFVRIVSVSVWSLAS